MRRQPGGSALPRIYPEFRAGGYSRVDGTVAFFLRVQALLEPTMTVLDYGAGRGEWMDSPGTQPIHRRLRLLRGQVARVVGVDIDPAVRENESLDEALVVDPGDRIPLPDHSVDLLLADHTFEHIDDPQHFSAEVTRLIRPGGWLCARTPNGRGYIAVAARLVPNRAHARVLGTLQPTRPSRDVFPTRYTLNTPAALRQHFSPDDWEHVVFTHTPEPTYFAESVLAWRFGTLLARMLPPALGTSLHIFLRRRES